MTAMTGQTPPSQASRTNSADAVGEVLRIVLIYAAFAAAWILFSDRIAGWLFHNVEDLVLAGVIKGLAFVLATSILLYWLMRRRLGLMGRVENPTYRRPVATMALLALGIATLCAGAIVMVTQQQKAAGAARLQTISDLITRHIADWLRERKGDAAYLNTSRLFSDLFTRGWGEPKDLESRERMQSRLEEYVADNGFTAAMLLGPQGERLWGTRRAPNQVNATLAREARLAAQGRSPSLIGPYLDESGLPHLDIVVPLRQVQGTPPSIVLHIDPADWLYPALRAWPVPSASGETLLFRRDGDQILYLNELRHHKDSAARLRLPLDTTGLLAAQALGSKGKEGEILEGVDYRRVPALGVVRPVPGTDWYLVAKMDRSEMFATAHLESIWIGLTGLLVLFAAATGLHLSRQRQALALARQTGQAQSERLRALRLLAAIADTSEDAILAKDLEGRYLLFNRAAERFTGKPAEEVLGKDDDFLFPESEARFLKDFGRRVIKENRVITEEEILTTPMGMRTFLATKGPLHDDEGRVVGIYGITRDVSDYLHAESLLADQMKRFRLLLDNSRDGIVIIDQDHQVMEANQRFADMLGYSAEEVLRLHTWDFDAVMDERQIREGFSDLSHTNRVFETRHRRKDGSEYDVEVSASGAIWSGQNLVLCVCRDISERRQIQAQLQLWANAFENANFALAIADATNNTFLAVNPTFARERGYRPEELVGLPFLTVYPADLRESTLAKVSLLDKVGHGVFEAEHVARDGRRFPVLMDITVMRDADGKPLRRVAYALDITRRKEAEATLAIQTEEMKRRNEELERFNRVTVGRELDLIELKKQVNALSRDLGREPPYPLDFLGDEEGRES